MNKHERLPPDADTYHTLWWLGLALRTNTVSEGPSGFVYFATDDELVKIGFSAAPELRVKALKRERPKPKNPVRLLSSAVGTMGHERLFHALFWEHWIEGEWFFPSPEVTEAIRQAEAGMCAERILLYHVGRRREPFKSPRYGPANRSRFDTENIEYIKGGISTFESIEHPKGSLPEPVISRTMIWRGGKWVEVADYP